MRKHLFFIAGLTAALAVPAGAAPVVSKAWIRAMPGNLPAAGYFMLANTGGKPLDLVGASSPVCGSLMLHMTHNMGGMVHMMEVGKVTVPAGGSFEFKPGGHHLMCMEPKGLKPGTTASVTLNFASGEKITVPFAVKTATGQ